MHLPNGKIELHPGLLAASSYHGVGNVRVSDHFSNFLSLMYIFSQNGINARDVSKVKFRMTVNKEVKEQQKWLEE